MRIKVVVGVALCLFAAATAFAQEEIEGRGTINYIPVFSGSHTVGNSVIYQSNGHIGIGTTNPLFPVHVNGAGESLTTFGLQPYSIYATMNSHVNFSAAVRGDSAATSGGGSGVIGVSYSPEGTGVYGLLGASSGLLVIDPTASRRVALAQQPYSTLVAGIYSTKPGMLGTTRNVDESAPQNEVPLAVVGIVPCKVTAENGSIRVGDLLVTSSTAGHAMKGTDRSKMLGAVVGKALEPLAEGKGVIQVLVTLQ